MMERRAKVYDYIIVGAGSAGCTLASRLTESGSYRVLLLEAGGWDWHPYIHIPLAWGKILGERRHDWMYFTAPETRLDNREIECARGKVIGGSSSINAMLYCRGNRDDYERWAASGLPEWDYAHVLPYFRKQESWEFGANTYRGGDGPLNTMVTRYQDPLIEAYFEAGREIGYPTNPDYNGKTQEGLGYVQSTIRSGRRCSAAVAYLRPALARDNLQVITGALTTNISFEGTRATGVEFQHRGRKGQAEAEREVIICGGAINTPQILMLSGIGDPALLKALDIPVRAALPGVGRNLQDHLSVAVDYDRAAPGPFHHAMRVDRIAKEVLNTYFRGKGFATELPAGFTGFVKSRHDQVLPDVQLIFRAAPLAAWPYLEPFRKSFPDSFACRAVLLRPHSRGHIDLVSKDPTARPRILQNFLADRRDWETLRAGLRLSAELGRQRSLMPYIRQQKSPGIAPSDHELDAHIRGTALTAHHPLGTCKMGPSSDSFAVVGSDLRVHGMESLRVVDASVMPDMIGGNINAAVIMMGERAADLILGRRMSPGAHLSSRRE
ncbi:GMC family oxidoreductase [Xanthobacter sp. ZOL 2024]